MSHQFCSTSSLTDVCVTSAGEDNALASFARWCFHHRKAVLALWLMALIGFLAAGRVGAAYTNTFSLPGTDSTKALSVLEADFATRAGDSDQIVVQARRGTLRSPAVEAAIKDMVARVGRLPHVRAVASPYGPGGQISRDGTIGFAVANLDALAQNVPKAAVSRLISTARSADSSLLNVQLGGQAIANNQPSGGNTSLLLGIVLALIVPHSAAPCWARCFRSSRPWLRSGWGALPSAS